MNKSFSLRALALSFIVCTFCAACAQNAPESDWRTTSRDGLWSRENLVPLLDAKYKFEGMPRAEVLKLLGNPEYSEKSASSASSDISRTDIYQLSALNNSSFEFNYDKKDKVTHHYEGIGCLANYFPGPDASLTSKQNSALPAPLYAARSKLAGDPADQQIKDLKQIWGQPDMSEVDIVPSFPTPLRTSFYSWRTSPDGRSYNLAESTEPFNVDPDHRHVTTLLGITLSPDCPVRRKSERMLK